jgi:hypothetical protein
MASNTKKSDDSDDAGYAAAQAHQGVADGTG